MSLPRRLVLVGSGEFTPALIEADRYLLSLVNKRRPQVAVIATAAGRELAFDRWLSDGSRHFSKLGASPIPIPVKNRLQANQPSLAEPAAQADLIYFSGGDPGYLYRSLKGSFLWQIILNRFRQGTILAGSSAGAMIFGGHLITNPYAVIKQHAQPNWQTGFNLLLGAIIPHYDYLTNQEANNFAFILTHTPKAIQSSMLGIDENTALLLTDESAQVFGRGRIHRISPKQMYSAGARLSPPPQFLKLSPPLQS